MTLTAYRLTQHRFVSTAFSGDGARLYGGRWNSTGTSMVYTASSVSLATLELLVHVEDITIIYNRYSVIPVSFPSSLVEKLDAALLPPGWNAPSVVAATQLLGDAWARQLRSAVLEVPSAVTDGERNYLFNPAHRAFAKVAIGAPNAFSPDPRLQR